MLWILWNIFIRKMTGAWTDSSNLQKGSTGAWTGTLMLNYKNYKIIKIIAAAFVHCRVWNSANVKFATINKTRCSTHITPDDTKQFFRFSVLWHVSYLISKFLLGGDLSPHQKLQMQIPRCFSIWWEKGTKIIYLYGLNVCLCFDSKRCYCH